MQKTVEESSCLSQVTRRRAVRVRCPRRPVFVTARNWGCDIAREVVRHDETETDPQKLAIKVREAARR
jgi:hypothetical protein